LHRKIDSYTDSHPIVKESCKLLKESYGRYAGIITDMFYDHFLACNWDTYHDTVPLSKFVSKTHKILMLNYFRLPNEVKSMLPFLIKSRRLENYANMAGIARALNIMARHTSLPGNTNDAIKCLCDNYQTFNEHFCTFYPDITSMVDEELKDVQKK
jgi:acyl carrier protein phosphodiesterase